MDRNIQRNRIVSKYLKREVTPKRVDIEKQLFSKLKEFKGKLIVHFVPRTLRATLIFPEGIWSRDFDEAEQAIKYFTELSIVCKDIARLKQDLKLLYLQEDIASD